MRSPIFRLPSAISDMLPTIAGLTVAPKSPACRSRECRHSSKYHQGQCLRLFPRRPRLSHRTVADCGCHELLSDILPEGYPKYGGFSTNDIPLVPIILSFASFFITSAVFGVPCVGGQKPLAADFAFPAGNSCRTFFRSPLRYGLLRCRLIFLQKQALHFDIPQESMTDVHSKYLFYPFPVLWYIHIGKRRCLNEDIQHSK